MVLTDRLGPDTVLCAGETECDGCITGPREITAYIVIQFCVVSVLREASWHHDDFSIEFLLRGTRKALGREEILELNVT